MCLVYDEINSGIKQGSASFIQLISNYDDHNNSIICVSHLIIRILFLVISYQLVL